MAWHVRQQQKRGLSAEFKADVWFAQYQVCAFVNSRPTGDVATVVVDGLDVAAPELADVAAIMGTDCAARVHRARRRRRR